MPVVHEWVLQRQQRQRVIEESQILSLRHQVEDARASLAEIGRVCEKAPEQVAKIQNLEQALAGVDAKLDKFGSEVGSSIKVLHELDSKTAALEKKAREGAASEAAKAVEAVQNDVKNRLENVEGRFKENLERLAGLEAKTREERNLEDMRHDMLDPIVQLNGDDTVGSGVLLFSQKDPSGMQATFVISSYHVVRNIFSEMPESAKDKGIRISTYQNGKATQELGDMVAHDEEVDLVLIRLRGEKSYPYCARLLSADTVARVTVFTPVYAVGCPLGNDPIPTYGEIASLSNNVSNRNYWMINAPTYFGNSGGGIFLARSHELAGVFSKIYTHGSGRPTVIPHMGLATPASAVAEFLDRTGFGFVKNAAMRVAAASANRPDAAEGKK